MTWRKNMVVSAAFAGLLLHSAGRVEAAPSLGGGDAATQAEIWIRLGGNVSYVGSLGGGNSSSSTLTDFGGLAQSVVYATGGTADAVHVSTQIVDTYLENSYAKVADSPTFGIADSRYRLDMANGVLEFGAFAQGDAGSLGTLNSSIGVATKSVIVHVNRDADAINPGDNTFWFTNQSWYKSSGTAYLNVDGSSSASSSFVAEIYSIGGASGVPTETLLTTVNFFSDSVKVSTANGASVFNNSSTSWGINPAYIFQSMGDYRVKFVATSQVIVETNFPEPTVPEPTSAVVLAVGVLLPAVQRFRQS